MQNFFCNDGRGGNPGYKKDTQRWRADVTTYACIKTKHHYLSKAISIIKFNGSMVSFVQNMDIFSHLSGGEGNQ